MGFGFVGQCVFGGLFCWGVWYEWIDVNWRVLKWMSVGNVCY